MVKVCTGLFTGVGDSAELFQVLSRDILSVHWARAATHWDGSGPEKGCDVSHHGAVSAFLEKRENHAMYGALLTAVTGACSRGFSTLSRMEAVSGVGRSVTTLSTNFGLAP